MNSSTCFFLSIGNILSYHLSQKSYYDYSIVLFILNLLQMNNLCLQFILFRGNLTFSLLRKHQAIEQVLIYEIITFHKYFQNVKQVRVHGPYFLKKKKKVLPSKVSKSNCPYNCQYGIYIIFFKSPYALLVVFVLLLGLGQTLFGYMFAW